MKPEHDPSNFFVRYKRAIARDPNVSSIIDFIYETLDEHLLAGRFELVDRILMEVAAKGPRQERDGRVAIGFLTITSPWRDHLPSRPDLVASTQSLLLGVYSPGQVDEILKGLR